MLYYQLPFFFFLGSLMFLFPRLAFMAFALLWVLIIFCRR